MGDLEREYFSEAPPIYSWVHNKELLFHSTAGEGEEAYTCGTVRETNSAFQKQTPCAKAKPPQGLHIETTRRVNQP